ncbi:MAG: hypothetical protein ACOX7R_01190 [Acetivibrionales bacterium]
MYENFVFYPPYVKAKELIDNGEIGEPISIRIKLKCRKAGPGMERRGSYMVMENEGRNLWRRPTSI